MLLFRYNDFFGEGGFITKADLAKGIYEGHGGLTIKEAKDIVDTLFTVIAEGLKKEGHLVISGFGTFRVVKRKAKIGRIIKEKKTIIIPERNNVIFIPSRTRLT